MTHALIRPDVLYAWSGPSLLITNTRGECGHDQPLSGFYHRETRFLRVLRLEVNGQPPWRCEAAAVDPDTLTLNFNHPQNIEYGGGGTGSADDEERTDAAGLPERALDLRVTYDVQIAALLLTLVVTNRSRRALTFEIAWELAADFADIQEAFAGRREQEAVVDANARNGHLAFEYRHQRLPFRTSVDLHGAAEWQVTGARVSTDITLEPQQTKALSVRVVPSGSGADLTDHEVREREQLLRDWRESFATVTAGNTSFERVLANNVRDFGSLPLLAERRDEWLAPQAGLPLYPAFFGRDALTAGWQAGYVDRGQTLAAALTRLQRLQSERFDEWRDEEPGRIPYQVRCGPLALLGLNPYSAYYADYVSPLMFVVSLANLYAWTGDKRLLKRHWDAARRMLDWARESGDRDRDGYLEYETRSSQGTKNQGWKDSGDAITYDDGTPVPSPIGTCELQGYWYAAQQLMAGLCWLQGERDNSAAYRESAADLKRRFNREWWLDDESFFALALDPRKRLVRALTSNVGHCLACGIIEDERLPGTVERMFAPDLFSGWGIRTLSTGHRFYNPLSYHRGTVWAVEQAAIAFGLRRFGFDQRALDLTRALLELALLYPENRIPECVGGYARDERPVPGAYPQANAPQLWNATAFPLLVQTMLGLLPLAPVETLVLDPVLPDWLPDLELHRLRVGDAEVSLRFTRAENGTVHWDVLDKRGTLHIVRQPPPESLTAGWGERMRGVLETSP